MADDINEKYLSELWQEGRERDNKLNDLDRTIDDAVLERVAAKKPKNAGAAANYVSIESRELYTYLQLVMGQFTEKPRFEINEITATNRAIQRADEDQRWANTIIWEIERQQANAVHRKVIGDIFKYDRGVVKIHAAMQLQGASGPLNYEDDAAILEWKQQYDDKRHYLPIPIAFDHVQPPLFHLWEDKGVGPSQAMEFRLRQVRELIKIYPESAHKLEKYNLAHYVWWFEHQDRELCTYGFAPSSTRTREGVTPPIRPGLQILRQWEHKYGRVSYVFIPGDESGLDEPSERWVSLLWPMLDLMKNRDLTISQIATHVRATAWFYPILELSEESTFQIDEDTQRPKTIDLHPFEWTVLMRGEKASAFQPPQLSPDAYRIVEKMDSLIQTHGLLPVLQGNVADYTAGYPLNQRMHAARSRYNVISEHLKDGWAQIGHLLFTMVDVLNVPVSVFSSMDTRDKKGGGELLDLTPIRARQPRIIHGEWPLALPTDMALMARIGRELAAPVAPDREPLMSIRQVRQKFLDDENSELTSREIEREEFRAQVKVAAIQHAVQLATEGITKAFEPLPTPDNMPQGGVPGQMPGQGVAPGAGMPVEPGAGTPGGTGAGPTGLVPGQTGGQAQAEMPLAPMGGGVGR